MPRTRSPKRGSFGTHFDELVKHFTPEPASNMTVAPRLPKGTKPVKARASVNHVLLDDTAR